METKKRNCKLLLGLIRSPTRQLKSLLVLFLIKQSLYQNSTQRGPVKKQFSLNFLDVRPGHSNTMAVKGLHLFDECVIRSMYLMHVSVPSTKECIFSLWWDSKMCTTGNIVNSQRATETAKTGDIAEVWIKTSEDILNNF